MAIRIICRRVCQPKKSTFQANPNLGGGLNFFSHVSLQRQRVNFITFIPELDTVDLGAH
jgi:hypothetical protein